MMFILDFLSFSIYVLFILESMHVRSCLPVVDLSFIKCEEELNEEEFEEMKKHKHYW
jgi:hypothetical protein